MSNKPKIIFLLASISQPRCLKRIKAFVKEGYELEVYGFDRGYYNNEATVKEYDIKTLGFMPSGSGYLKKVLYARKKLNAVFKKNKSANVLYYCFSFDLALICKLYNKKYAYEISDLVYGYFHNRSLRSIFTSLDRRLIGTSFVTAMTSIGFKKHLYPKGAPPHVIIQPNRIDRYFSSVDRRLNGVVATNNLTFSYVGAFRSPDTVFRFAKIIGENFPQHSFRFHGDSHLTEQAKDLASKYANVTYHGSFKNPDDLSDIYSKIDVVIACYGINTLNERIADPNKLYEALFFNKPIIVSKNTFLAQQVLDTYKCGYAIDATNDDEIIELVNSLTPSSMKPVIDSIHQVALENIIDDDSYKLIHFIKNNFPLSQSLQY